MLDLTIIYFVYCAVVKIRTEQVETFILSGVSGCAFNAQFEATRSLRQSEGFFSFISGVAKSATRQNLDLVNLGSSPNTATVAVADLVMRLTVVQVYAGSNPVGHPKILKSQNRKPRLTTTYEQKNRLDTIRSKACVLFAER